MERIRGAALGLEPGNSPLLVEALQNALEALRAKRGVALCLEPGEYHFYPRHAPCRELCISNHDPEPRRPVAFLLEGFDGLCIDGGGSRFVFHTEILPFYIASSRGVRLENFSLDYARPAYSEGEILSVQPQEMVVRIDPAKYPWQVRQGRLVFWGENFCHPLHLWLELDAQTGAPAWGTDDLYFRTERQTQGLDLCAEAMAPDLVRLTLSGPERFFAASRPGNRLVFRHHPRTYPAFYAADCSDLALENIAVRHAAGMAFLAERCTGVALTRFDLAPDPASPRCFTAAADATHFVNCAGELRLEECRFESQLDDGVNVHGFYAPVRGRPAGQSLLLGWGHPGQQGTLPGRPGDEVALMGAEQLRPVWTARLKRLCPQKEGILAEFDAPLPDSLPERPVLENLSLSPRVVIRGCTFRKNRARGVLLTCREALVENCLFETAGAAVYLEGEACYWYESGATRSLCLQNNRFVNCAYIPAWGAAPITACPKVRSSGGWFFHAKLTIRDNEFFCFDQRVLSLRQVGETRFCNNRRTRTRAYPARSGEQYDVADCGAFYQDYQL